MAYPKVNDSVWPEFLERIRNGEAVRAICKDKTMPSWATVARKIAAEPEFEQQYRMALEFRGMLLAEELDEIYRDTRAGMIDPASARVAADILKWQAARMTPKIYGDKQQVEVAASKGGSYLEALTQVNAIEPVVLTDERDTQAETLRARDGGQPKSG